MKSLREIAETPHELEMTPLIDVTFLLLVFFLLTLRFKTLEGKLSAFLPQDSGLVAEATEEVQRLDLAIEVVPGQEGQRRIASGPRRGAAWTPGSLERFEIAPGTRALRYTLGARRFQDLDALRVRIEDLAAADLERAFTLDARSGTAVADVVPVLDALLEAGFTAITFRGEPDADADALPPSR